MPGENGFDKIEQMGQQGMQKAAAKGVQATGKLGAKGAKKAANAIKNKIKGKKTPKGALKQAVKKAAEALIRKIVALLGSFAGWILGIAIIAAMAFAILNATTKTHPSTDNGSIYTIPADWQQRLTYSFYAYYSDRAFYYVIDNESEMHQGLVGDTSATIKDKYEREKFFTLSTSFLKYMDEELNAPSIMPEQFIKPIFSTCVEDNHKGACELKQLVDGDTVVADSQAFTEKDSCDGVEDCVEDSFWQTDKGKTERGIWDYGLAPIIHYTKKEEATWTQNLRLSEIKYFDEESSSYKYCSGEAGEGSAEECPEEILNQVKNTSDAKKYLPLEEMDRKVNNIYLIDQVATFIGTVSNEIEETTEDTGEDWTAQGVIKNRGKTKNVLGRTSNFKDAKNEVEKAKEKEDSEETFEWHITLTENKETYANLNEFNKDPKLKEIISKVSFQDNGTFISSITNEFFLSRLSDSTFNFMLYSQSLRQSIKNSKTSYSDMVPVASDSQKTGSPIKPVGYIMKWQTVTDYDCQDIKITSNTKIVCKPFDDGGDIEITVGKKCENGACLYNGTSDYKNLESGQTTVTRSISLQKTTLRPISYTIRGDKWHTEFGYKDASPSVDVEDSAKYLTDYINYYEYYEPVSNYTNSFHYDDYETLIESDMGSADEKEFEGLLTNLYGQSILTQKYEIEFSSDDSMGTTRQSTESEEDKKDDEDESVVQGSGIQRNTTNFNTMKQQWNSGFAGSSNTMMASVRSALENAANWTGMPLNVLRAMAFQESSFQHEAHAYSGAGRGLMQIELSAHNGSAVKTVNASGTETKTINVNAQSLANVNDNALVGAEYLKGHMGWCEGNILCAIYSYNLPERAHAAILAYADAKQADKSKILEDVNDIGWYNPAYTGTYQGWGDKLYLEHVLQYIGNDELSDDSMIIEYSWQGKFYSIDVAKLMNGGSSLSQNDIETYINWSVNKKVLSQPKNWTIAYRSKPQSSAEIKLEKNKFKNDDNASYYHGDVKQFSKENLQMVLAKYFAAEDNVEVTQYMDEITDEMWKEKFASFFSSSGNEKVTIKETVYEDYFNDTPKTPLEDVYSIDTPYGIATELSTRNQYKTTFYQKIRMKAKEDDQDVYPVDGGTVVAKNSSTITIRHKGVDNEESKTVETVYSGFAVKDDLNIGDKVERTDTLGKIDDTYLELGLKVNDSYENPTWILKMAKEYNNIFGLGGKDINPEALQKSNEDTKKMIKYVLDHADEIEKKWKDGDLAKWDPHNDFVGNTFDKTVTVTGIAWTYDGGGNSAIHEAVDLAPGNLDTGIYAPQDAIVYEYQDGFPNNAGRGYIDPAAANYYFGLANHVSILLYGTDGYWYQLTFGHCNPNDEKLAVSKHVSNPVIKKGTRIGTIGHSGMSTGPHTHLTVLRLGKQSLKSIATFWSQNADKWALYSWGVGGKDASHRCESKSPPCQQAPHALFGLGHGQSYQGKVSAHW